MRETRSRCCARLVGGPLKRAFRAGVDHLYHRVSPFSPRLSHQSTFPFKCIYRPWLTKPKMPGRAAGVVCRRQLAVWCILQGMKRALLRDVRILHKLTKCDSPRRPGVYFFLYFIGKGAKLHHCSPGMSQRGSFRHSSIGRVEPISELSPVPSGGAASQDLALPDSPNSAQAGSPTGFAARLTRMDSLLAGSGLESDESEVCVPDGTTLRDAVLRFDLASNEQTVSMVPFSMESHFFSRTRKGASHQALCTDRDGILPFSGRASVRAGR